jgi:hypothetical protein
MKIGKIKKELLIVAILLGTSSFAESKITNDSNNKVNVKNTKVEDTRGNPNFQIKDKNNNKINKTKLLSKKEKEILTKKRLDKSKKKNKIQKKTIKSNKVVNNSNNKNSSNNKKIDEKERNYELLLKLLVSDDKENMNIALTEQEIKEKKEEEKKKQKLADEAYDLNELNRQMKLLPIPKKTILIGSKRIVFADYTIYPYIPKIRDLIGDTVNELSKTDKIKEKEEEQGNETSVITIQDGDIFMNNWIVYKTTESYVLYKNLNEDDLYVKKYMLNKENK